MVSQGSKGIREEEGEDEEARGGAVEQQQGVGRGASLTSRLDDY